jgi:Ankyrin repeats (3 copies)
MNKFVRAIKDLDITLIEELLQKRPKWINWSEDSGKNALHYLCGLNISEDEQKAGISLQILKRLLKGRMDINSIHQIKDGCGFFPGTPLWYAYARGRNETLYTYLLSVGASPDNCMFAIAWYDDAKAAALFNAHGAKIDDVAGSDTPFIAAIKWRKFNVAEWFLKNGSNVNFADQEGNTVLFYAVKRNFQIEYIRLLLQYGANFNKENKEGLSPKKLAELNHQRNILNLLKDR